MPNLSLCVLLLLLPASSASAMASDELQASINTCVHPGKSTLQAVCGAALHACWRPPFGRSAWETECIDQTAHLFCRNLARRWEVEQEESDRQKRKEEARVRQPLLAA
jgi:hypothetical protein